MSETAVFQALKSTGYPVHLLGAHDDSSLPRISYSFPSAPGFFADSRTYRPMERCEVRLYTDQYPDEAAESAVETTIGRLGFAYAKHRVPIPSERMHETTYTFTDLR